MTIGVIIIAYMLLINYPLKQGLKLWVIVGVIAAVVGFLLTIH